MWDMDFGEIRVSAWFRWEFKNQMDKGKVISSIVVLMTEKLSSLVMVCHSLYTDHTQLY